MVTDDNLFFFSFLTGSELTPSIRQSWLGDAGEKYSTYSHIIIVSRMFHNRSFALVEFIISSQGAVDGGWSDPTETLAHACNRSTRLLS